MNTFRAPVMTPDVYRAWSGDRRSGELREHMWATGLAPVRILGSKSFLWACPGCGGCHIGDFGDEPVSGWEAPRWTREGDDEHLTLSPSLGCPDWRDGIRPEGHYWLRDGELVPA